MKTERRMVANLRVVVTVTSMRELNVRRVKRTTDCPRAEQRENIIASTRKLRVRA